MDIKNFFRIVLQGGDVDFIAEYASPFDVAYTLPVKVLFLFVFGYLCFLTTLKWREIRFSSLLPSLGIIYLSLGYFRATPFPFLVALPLMVKTVSKYKVSKRLSLIPFLVCICFAIVCHYYYINNNFHVLTRISTSEPGVGKSNVYQDTIPNYVLENYPDENVYNTYNIGSYLLWHWYGKKKVFIDSRSANYESNFYKEYREHCGEKYINEYGLKSGVFSIIMDQKDINEFLKIGWFPVVFDTSMVVLSKDVETPVFLGGDVKSLPVSQQQKMRAFVANFINMMSRGGYGDEVAGFCGNNEKLLRDLKINIDVKKGE